MQIRLCVIRAALPLVFAVAAISFGADSVSSTTLGPPAAGLDSGEAPLFDYRTRTEGVELNRVGVRFTEESGARVRGGQLVSLRGFDLSHVERVVAGIPGADLGRRFHLDEAACDDLRVRGEARTLTRLPNLNLFAMITLPEAATPAEARSRLRNLLRQLNSLPGVAEAWGLAKGEIATLPAVPTTETPTTETPLAARGTTPDFTDMQGYLFAPPTGFGAESVWGFPGGLGQGIQILGMEWGWRWDHEDVPVPFFNFNDQGPSDHGTATLGIFGGRHNGYGVSGIAGEAELGSIYLGDIAADILRTAEVLDAGDVFSMSIQVSGPEGWMPTEWWPDTFAAMQTVSALGILGVQAAGNAEIDLDSPIYGGAFDRRVRDSGAFIIGGGTPNGLDAEWYTNYGSRVSLQGWGSSVVTTGYGDLQGGDPTAHYTGGFGGTSAATPCVAGCLASLQGQALANFGEPITPALAEEIMRTTGTPQTGEKLIGPRPNLIAARERLLLGFGDVVVTVIDGDTQAPLSDWIVRIDETGRMHKTGPSGQIAMQLTAGDLTFHVPPTFLYQESFAPFFVEAGGNQSITIEVYRFPTGDLSGFVRNESGTPLEGVQVVVEDTPLAAVFTDAQGAYSFVDVPERPDYGVVASNLPFYGAEATDVAVSSSSPATWSPILANAEPFEATNGAFAESNEWQWGTPTFPNGPNKPIPFSGDQVWGLDLSGPYNALETSILTSPVYDLTGETELTLSFHHWMWIAGDDGGQVQVWDENQSDWVVVTPRGGYPDDNITILFYEPGYNGIDMEWRPAIFDLDEYAGGPFQFRFYFKSNFETEGIGWYVDDVALDTGDATTSVEFDSAADAPRILWAGPSPSSGESVIRLAAPDPQAARCEVYDVRGALVRRLAPIAGGTGASEFHWDGRDEGGVRVGSGLYLYRVHAGREVLTGRLLRVR